MLQTINIIMNVGTVIALAVAFYFIIQRWRLDRYGDLLEMDGLDRERLLRRRRRKRQVRRIILSYWLLEKRYDFFGF